MTRPLLIAGNWKLNLGPVAAAELALCMRTSLEDRGTVEVAFFPTAISAFPVLKSLAGSGIEVGLQDIHTKSKGAYTGANSAIMARVMGCTRVLVGHSERRHVFGETNEQTGSKVLVAREAGLLPVLCVGETLQQRNDGIAKNTIISQLESGMKHLKPDQLSGFVIAYEPVWAIGTGVVATPKQAQAMHQTIRAWLASHYPPFIATETKILYGGSVKPGNARDLLSCSDIDGALIGGASLNVESFRDIVKTAVKNS